MANMLRKLIRAQITALGDDEVEVVMSTAALARDGHVLIPQGCRLDNYRANPIVLWSHDADKPVGNAETVVVGGDEITARIRFAPAGIARKADEVRGLTKAGVIRAVSVGFDPLEMEPLDPQKPRGGQRIAAWELLELSFVSVPADPGAVVTNRAHGDAAMPATDPITDRRATRTTPRVGAARAVLPPGRRGLYQVAQLCYLFESLGYQVDNAKYEAAIEGDASKVPAMLAAVLHDLGDALLAMTQEEIAEALAGLDVEPAADEDADDGALVVEERAHIRAAGSPAVRAFRRGLAHAKLRAGKTLSAATMRCLRDARALHEEAIELNRSALRKHKDGLAAVDEMMDGAGGAAAEGDATETEQASAGSDDDGAAAERASADFRRRQVALLALAPAA